MWEWDDLAPEAKATYKKSVMALVQRLTMDDQFDHLNCTYWSDYTEAEQEWNGELPEGDPWIGVVSMTWSEADKLPHSFLEEHVGILAWDEEGEPRSLWDLLEFFAGVHNSDETMTCGECYGCILDEETMSPDSYVIEDGEVTCLDCEEKYRSKEEKEEPVVAVSTPRSPDSKDCPLVVGFFPRTKLNPGETVDSHEGPPVNPSRGITSNVPLDSLYACDDPMHNVLTSYLREGFRFGGILGKEDGDE